ncbi:MAG: hypothetical protein Q7T55_01060, partial [Solirubrobacteraceae bacterium]|nr:hypothetical protein [Solirubrobacteraceae bacterium]
MPISSPTAIRMCRASGLHRSDPPGEGWTDETGAPVVDEATRARLDALRIPPAWRDVWASPDARARVQATGVDARGRTQYRYSTAAEQQAAEQKFEHLLPFGDALPRLRAQVDRHLAAEPTGSTGAEVRRATAAVIRLIDRGLFRVGTDRYARDNHTYGLTTLTREHVRVDGTSVEFTFIGKEHRPWHLVVDDAGVAPVVAQLLADAPEGAPLFAIGSGGSRDSGGSGGSGGSVGSTGGRHVVSSAVVNAYIHAA